MRTASSSHISLYDEDALDDAVADWRRYLAGEGAPYAPLLEVGVRIVAAATPRTGQPRGTARRRLRLRDTGSSGGRRSIATSTSRCSRAHRQINSSVVVRSLHLAAAPACPRFDTTGADADGGEFEWTFHTITTIDADGRIARFEYFAEDDFAAALARLDELGAVAPADAVTHASRTPRPNGPAGSMS